MVKLSLCVSCRYRGMEVSPWLLITCRKSPTHSIRGCVSPRSCLVILEKSKILLCWESNPNFSSAYPSYYPDYCITATPPLNQTNVRMRRRTQASSHPSTLSFRSPLPLLTDHSTDRGNSFCILFMPTSKMDCTRCCLYEERR
jgi:hypothetical protein